MQLSVLYDRLRGNPYLHIFVILTRFLIGFAFVPSGLKKVLGLRFTSLGTNNSIGFFFEAMYQTGFYWNFLGWAQVVAALLLMTQRFATLGAALFFGIITNIWLITVSMQFTGTWVITSLMWLACVMLLAWDFHKFKYLFFPDHFGAQPAPPPYPTHNRTWELTGLALFLYSLIGSYFLETATPPVDGWKVLAGLSVLFFTTLAVTAKEGWALLKK